MTSTIPNLTASLTKTSETSINTNSIIPLLQQAGFNLGQDDKTVAQQISNYIIQQRINDGKSTEINKPISQEEIITLGKKPIPRKEVTTEFTTHADVIRSIINSPKQEAPKQEARKHIGYTLANVEGVPF